MACFPQCQVSKNHLPCLWLLEKKKDLQFYMKSVTQGQGTANEAMGGPYLAFEENHWADKPSSAPSHLAAVDEVLQLAHLHGALEPNT